MDNLLRFSVLFSKLENNLSSRHLSISLYRVTCMIIKPHLQVISNLQALVFLALTPWPVGKYIQKKISSEQHEGIQISVKCPNIVQPWQHHIFYYHKQKKYDLKFTCNNHFSRFLKTIFHFKTVSLQEIMKALMCRNYMSKSVSDLGLSFEGIIHRLSFLLGKW